MIGGALMLPAVKGVKRRTDYDEAGGGPLLGLNGICVICHGSSNAKAIMNALRMAAEAVHRQLVSRVREDLEFHHSAMKKAGVSGEALGE
jgi:glycerol-3-phosphate acyltransferase PlsX